MAHGDPLRRGRDRQRRAKGIGGGPPPSRLYQGKCKTSGKRKFSSEIDVLIGHMDNPRPIRAYVCPSCGTYHAATRGERNG